ncbi:hypothetical protein [Jannaschia donghaensis]|uniref:Uncharacterized protein n=1 Tax=Jannaschia donghaensis TaxID=420998 RepID=A0A0M6YMQ4_9RHOB|nr:hypothetical protein [Jannaschia donghaensis]CTQ50316.1 hypothetical protein JDO7802_02337 [Jannaschia donghaensis]
MSRNLIDFARVAIATGFALRQGGVLEICPVPFLIAVLVRRFAVPEETALRAAFDGPAAAYLRDTRRWL